MTRAARTPTHARAHAGPLLDPPRPPRNRAYHRNRVEGSTDRIREPHPHATPSGRTTLDIDI
ncbi:hypothetical protein ABIA38_007553 [Embleya sp. AB8]